MKPCSLTGALRRYYRAIRKKLVCPAPLRRQTLQRLQSGVDDFLDDCPSATIEQVTARFGTPEQIADGVLSAMEPEEVRRYARKVHIVRAVVAAVLLLLSLIVIWYFTISALRVIYAAKEETVIIIGPAQSVASIPPSPTD